MKPKNLRLSISSSLQEDFDDPPPKGRDAGNPTAFIENLSLKAHGNYPEKQCLKIIMTKMITLFFM